MSIVKKTSIVILLFLTAGCAGLTSAKTPQDNEEKKQVEYIKRRIDQAVKSARKSGKKVVNVYLNEIPGIAQMGDLAWVDFTVNTEDGTEVFSSRERYKGPVDVLVDASMESFNLGKIVVGMREGKEKQELVPPQKAFGVRRKGLVKKYPRERTYPMVMEMGVKYFQKRFRKTPEQGLKIYLCPYFKGLVQKVDKGRVFLRCLVKDGEKFTDDLGITRISISKNRVILRLTPRIGAQFPVQGRKGIIRKVDDKYFTVDFNNPLAGKKVLVKVKLVSITKASRLISKKIDWISSYEEATEQAMTKQKPMVVVLYSHSCGWCKRFLNLTLKDPRVVALRDRFLWVKIDSGEQPVYKEIFRQRDFPLTVFLDPSSREVMRLSGYRTPANFRNSLLDMSAS